MTLDTNPFTNPPTLLRPQRLPKTRSPSHSPVRQHGHDIDPLLRDLSPSSTLRACVSHPGDMDANHSKALAKSIESASASERALGAKAARAHLNLRTWTQELENWQWPGAFDPPESAAKKARDNDNDSGTVYWGSLPAQTVREYEMRADEIGQHIDELDVEELKQYLLNSHYRVSSRPPSREDSISGIGGLTASTDLRKLDDFTALVTATILHALPYFSRLNRLIDVWTIRLIVLRGTPGFLRELREARTALDQAWTATIAPSGADVSTDHRNLDRASMDAMKTSLERQVGSLGRRLDRLLDSLEGGSDTLPDTWIDDFEHLEAAYGTWVVQAERQVLGHEWHDQRRQSSSTQADRAAPENLPTISETEDPASDDDAVRTVSQNVSPWLPQTEWASSSAQSGINGTSQHGQLREMTEQVAPMPAELPAISINAQTVPVLVAPSGEGNTEVLDGSTSQRSVRGASEERGTEPEMSSMAKQRAAFLNDIIERNQSLKQSKSPVRPFEHASNAFTRLFKKDRSPEQVKPKRTVSNKWREEDRTLDRKALSPVSLASSKFNSASGESSLRSGPDSSKSSVHEPDTSSEKQPGSTETGGPVLEPSVFARDVSSPALSVSSPPETYRPTGLSTPSEPPSHTEFPENWPLASPPATATPSDPHQRDEQQQTMTRSVNIPRDSGHEIETPRTPIETDTFDRLFIQSLPSPSIDRPTSARAPRSEDSWSVYTHKRPSSLPRSRPQVPEIPTKFDGEHSARASRPSRHSSQEALGSTSMSKQLKLHIPESTEDTPVLGEDELPENTGEVVFKIKRASVTSIGAFSRAQVRSIDVPKSRQNSVSPRVSPPRTPISRRSSADPPRVDGVTSDDAVDFKEDLFSSQHGNAAVLPEASSTMVENETPTIFRSSPVSAMGDLPTSPTSPTPELSTAMRKRRGQAVPEDENTRPSPSGTSTKSHPFKASKQQRMEGDSFDRHVSDVLETLPAPIRFKPRPGAVTPMNQFRGYLGPRSKTPTMRKGGDLVLAPAESSPRKSKSATEPEVKLYHLTHSGREDPIKLFVRIVGEGERVMVRVGGGWADLADYLRDFANHHGSRTVSEGNLEVQTVTSAPLSRKVSGPADLMRAKSPATPSYATPRPDSSDSDKEWPTKPLPMDMSSPTNQTTNGLDSTPKSNSSNSRPSTANASRPPSRQNTLDVGLSGTSSGKKLPDHKAKWVEGMIERAKKASAEKSKEDKEKHFNDIGKAGATRRLYFRSSSSGGGGA